MKNWKWLLALVLLYLALLWMCSPSGNCPGGEAGSEGAFVMEMR